MILPGGFLKLLDCADLLNLENPQDKLRKICLFEKRF